MKGKFHQPTVNFFVHVTCSRKEANESKVEKLYNSKIFKFRDHLHPDAELYITVLKSLRAAQLSPDVQQEDSRDEGKAKNQDGNGPTVKVNNHQVPPRTYTLRPEDSSV